MLPIMDSNILNLVAALTAVCCLNQNTLLRRRVRDNPGKAALTRPGFRKLVAVLRSPRETNSAMALGRAFSNSLLAPLIKVTADHGHDLLVSHLVEGL